MQKQTQPSIQLTFIILMAAVPLSCSRSEAVPPTLTPVNTTSLETATPTALPPLQAGGLPTGEPTPPPLTYLEIELRFIDPETQEECVTHFPFEILDDDEQASISGSGVIDCRFETQQCGDGVCVTYHSTYYLDGELTGFVRESTASYPEGALEAYLAGTFTLKQYWTDIPPETMMAFTEANPFEVSKSDIIPLFFHFVNGATQEIGGTGAPNAYPWVFTLHLE